MSPALTSQLATAGPRLLELTYRYQPKYAPDGQPITPGAVIHYPKASAAALTTLLRDEAVEVFGILCLTTTHRVICWVGSRRAVVSEPALWVVKLDRRVPLPDNGCSIVLMQRRCLTAGLLSVTVVVGALIVPPLHAQTATNQVLTFEVASVKLHSTSGINERSGIEETPGLIRIENLPLKGLIEAAYDVKDYQFSGPGWLDTARYDVLAKPPAGFTQSQLPPLLQTMLGDRFKLKAHYQSKEMAAYGMVVAKSGAKLQESTGSRTFFTARPGLISGTRVSMRELASALSGVLDRPTVDHTGLLAVYDVKIQWTPDSASGDLGLSLFTALTEQLGLKLEPTRTLIDVVVIDHVEPPTPD